jgi:hypothetical protein
MLGKMSGIDPKLLRKAYASAKKREANKGKSLKLNLKKSLGKLKVKTKNK